MQQALNLENHLRSQGIEEGVIEELVLNLIAPAEEIGLQDKPLISQAQFNQIVESLYS